MSTDERDASNNGGASKVINVRVPREQAEEFARVRQERGDELPQLLRRWIDEYINGPPPEPPTPMFPQLQPPPQVHGEKLEAVVRNELAACMVVVLTLYGFPAASAMEIVRTTYLDGRVQDAVREVSP